MVPLAPVSQKIALFAWRPLQPCLECFLRDPHGKVTSLPELDEEIDYLAAVISKQQETGVNQPVTPAQVSPKPKTDAKKQKKSSNTTLAPPTTKAAPTALPNPPLDPVGGEGPAVAPFPSRDIRLIMLIALVVLLGMASLAIAAVCWVRVQRGTRLAQKVDYPAFAGFGSATSSDGTSPLDKTLAQNAQMYHYQHQKQQMLSMEKHQDEPKVAESEATSDEETEDGDFTVYECPGLAPTGEMEVKNPLFDDSTLQPQRNHK
ncbi:hypothetical protein GJAV_G00039020 [Gymnothorax javanicus]|nr:hypothetical protein GJAV_G00039020 [Gymnothorax javanicus]